MATAIDATPTASPVHAALWSQPTGPGSKTRTTQISTPFLGAILLACLAIEMLTDVEAHGEGLLTSHNGLFMKFFKSLHAINHYWFRTRYISRSIVGCFALALPILALTLAPLTLTHLRAFLLCHGASKRAGRRHELRVHADVGGSAGEEGGGERGVRIVGSPRATRRRRTFLSGSAAACGSLL